VDIVIAQERIYAPCHPRAMKIDEPVLYRTGHRAVSGARAHPHRGRQPGPASVVARAFRLA
jgi:hypothetical protein